MMQNKNNRATVIQESSKYKYGNVNLSWIEQSGVDNGAFVVQDHNGIHPPPATQVALEAYIDQSGNHNEATQLQGPDPDEELGGLWEDCAEWKQQYRFPAAAET